jgi:nitroreductase
MGDVNRPDLPAGAQSIDGLYDGLMTLRAMRRFTDEPVADELVWAILNAGQQAPSGGNIQPWHFVVVTDAQRRTEIGELYRRTYDRYEAATLARVPPNPDPAAQRAWQRTVDASRHLAENLASVPVHIAVLSADTDMTTHDADGPLDIGSVLTSVIPAVQNIMLAARSFGLGTALTTVMRIEQAHVRELLSIPDRWQLAAYIPVGWPTGRFGKAPRRPVSAVTSWDSYGNRRRDPSAPQA